ncbi:hypothetical protein FSARC_2419 [Fusarium sarcochroum]|uniref:PET127 n=1 Tax=Fusarium sarcochroum TaxID=1208366 RepID=A0A8H4XD07_9HYPO|nr:hypothetical protein FSARC_2419 [Fusarium sarcochroum]
MLRARRGVGPSASFAHICRPYLRCPRQCTPLRSFATETNSDDPSNPPKAPKDNHEDSLDQLDSQSAELRARIKKLQKEAEGLNIMRKAALKKKQRTSKPIKADKSAPENSAVAGVGPDDNFNEALDVVRRVYGVDKPSKPWKKKGPQPRDSNEEKAPGPNNAGEAIKGSDTDATKSWSIAQQAGMWTSLRERLQQQQTSEPSNDPEEDPVNTLLDQDLQIFSRDLEAEAPGQDESGAVQESRIEQIIAEHRDTRETDAATASPASTKKAKKAKKTSSHPVQTIQPDALKLKPVEKDLAKEVPKLAYNLDKVLFNPGVYQLQDKRSRTYNFDPYLGSIMPVQEFDFNALKEYVTSSKDSRLRDLSAKHSKKYCGSTSSMTAMLSHFHFLLSAWRKPNFEQLSRSFKVEFESFTVLTRGPAAAFARYKDGVYAIDADKEFDSANILSMLGKSMEKLLTLPKEDFEKYRRTKSHELSEEEKNADEAFHYTTMGDFMMRSQLDAYDPRLPGTGMFDLKTRAVVSIRMDVEGYEKGVGYEIRNRFGTWESFEREYYDMIRAAFLKYSLQVRMGRMDGIFVAFHNTQRIFGFQYVSIEEMDLALHGTSRRKLGDDEFKTSVKLLNEVLNRASERFPKQSLRLHIETRPTNPPLTYFFAEPVTEEQIQRTQETGKASVEKFEKQILGITRDEIQEEKAMSLRDELVAQVEAEQQDLENLQEPEPVEDHQRQRSWDEMMAKVDHMVENDASGLQNVREAIEQALEQSGLLAGKSETERNAYLNELVEALSEELEDSKEVKEPEDALEKEPTEEEEVDQISQSISDVKPSPEAEAAVEDGTKEEDVSAEMVGDAVGGSALSSNDFNFADASLKDLILKVTQGVDNKASNLRTFERVLSELAQDQNETSIEADETGTADVDAIPTEDIEFPEADKSSSTKESVSGKEEEPQTSDRIFGAYVTVRNKLGDKVVERIDYRDPKWEDDWTVEYTVTELPPQRAQTILAQLKNRRRRALKSDPEDRTKTWHQIWRGSLPTRTAAGQRYRKQLTKQEKGKKVKVAWTLHRLSPKVLPSHQHVKKDQDTKLQSERSQVKEDQEKKDQDE